MPKDARPNDERATCYAAAVRKAARRVTQLYEHALAETGLSSTQFSILVELEARSAEPPSMVELAKALVLERSALGHTLKPLERDGLLAVQRSDADARKKIVVLTQRGRKKLSQAVPLWRAAQTRFSETVGERKAAQLREALLDVAYDERLGPLED